jgi:hypothetical protein
LRRSPQASAAMAIIASQNSSFFKYRISTTILAGGRKT